MIYIIKWRVYFYNLRAVFELYALKYREERLSFWKISGYLTGATIFSTFWIIFKIRYNPNFYFRNFCYYGLFTGLSAYIFGRYFEFYANVRFYREMMLKIANDYNISDNEISELYHKFNENALNKNKKNNTINNFENKF